MRARTALILCGHTYEHREVNLKDKPKSLLTYSPKGTVPVLILADGTVIDESLDIIKWAIKTNDPQHLARPITAEAILNDTMANFLPGIYQCKYPERYDVDQELVRANNREWLLALEKILSKQTYIIDQKLSYIDLAIYPFIRQWRHIDTDYFITNFKATNNWLTKITNADFFELVMANHITWQD